MHILPIASGKGGVGKSLIAANLALALSQAGKKVVLADLDLGGSNLHVILGVPAVKMGLGSFLNSPDVNFDDIIINTEHKNLIFIPGDAEIPGMANLSAQQKRTLIRNITSVDADFLILDLGAGTSYNIVDFFLISGQGIVVTTPALTATLSAYLFMKNTVYRIMKSSFKKNSPAYQFFEKQRKDAQAFQRMYIPKILETVRSIDPDSHELFSQGISRFHPRLILNMLEDPKDADRAGKLRRSCREYLDLDIEHLGVIYRDDLQDVALNSRIPILLYKPQSILSQAIYRIADKLIQLAEESESPVDIETIEDSYQAAETEAEVDFESKVGYLEDLLHCGDLSMGDLVETVKMQQFEIAQLKKENQLLKSKLVKAMNAGFKI